MGEQTIIGSKVIVCGAGIGGLTAAHELAKRGVQVVIYERNDTVGGLARSRYEQIDDYQYPVEYSWRVYGTGYRNLQRVLGEIPLADSQESSVSDNLVKIVSYLFPRFDRTAVTLAPGESSPFHAWELGKRDQWRMLKKIFFCLTISEARMDSMDNLTWQEYCRDLSIEANNYMVKMWGPALGMDPTYMSFPVIARFIGLVLGGYAKRGTALFVMNQPTNDGWFDEWVKYLQSTGLVTIRTGCEILDFDLQDGLIKAVKIHDKSSGKVFIDTADGYVCALSVETMAKIVAHNADLDRSPMLHKTIELAKRGFQVQLSVQMFLDNKIVYPTKNPPIIYLPDSPWAIIIEPEDLTWGQTYCDDPAVKAVWSVGVCKTDAPGIVHGKTFVECNEQEIQDELWAQIIKSYKKSGIKTAEGVGIEQVKIIQFYMWDSFAFDPQKKKISIWEPKFSNNAGVLAYQPECATEIDNFFFATGYTQTDRFIYSMESAAEAGVRAANLVARQLGVPGPVMKIYPFRNGFGIFAPWQWLDALFFKFGLPYSFIVYLATTLVITFGVIALVLLKLGYT